MDLYQWIIMGAAYAVMLAAFFSVFALEVRKNKKLKEAMPQYRLCTKRKPGGKIALIILAAIFLVGGPVAMICLSLLVEPIPREDFGAFIAAVVLIVFGGLICLFGLLGTIYNVIYVTEDGIWVRRFLLKSKFCSYDDVESVLDNTFSWNGGYTVFKKGRKNVCFISKRELNAKEVMAVIKERAPHLGKLKENELFRM